MGPEFSDKNTVIIPPIEIFMRVGLGFTFVSNKGSYISSNLGMPILLFWWGREYIHRDSPVYM